MALHRDIFWIGKQWTVTGSGIQAVDQRLRGILDIPVARLRDEAFVQSRRAKPGVNLEDFDKAVLIARTRYPRLSPGARLADQRLLPVDQDRAPAAAAVPPAFVIRAEGRLARFLPQWRIRR